MQTQVGCKDQATSDTQQASVHEQLDSLAEPKMSRGLHLVCGHYIGLDMGVLAAASSNVPMQEGALTADTGPDQLYLAHQAGCQYAAPMYKPLQATLHAEH